MTRIQTYRSTESKEALARAAKLGNYESVSQLIDKAVTARVKEIDRRQARRATSSRARSPVKDKRK